MQLIAPSGPLYYLYMALLSTFTTNSINILAGINGSEVSQALIIGVSVILNDLLYLPWPMDFRIPLHLLGSQAEVELGGPWRAGMAYGSSELVSRHLFSLYFMLPLVGVCLGFMYHNWSVSSGFFFSGINCIQVSRSCLSGRYTLLCHWDGFLRRWHTGSLFQNIAPVLHAADFQFCSLVPANIWFRPVPTAPGTKVCRSARASCLFLMPSN